MPKLLKQAPDSFPLPIFSPVLAVGLVLLFAFSLAAQPAPPTNLSADGYDSHIELHWNKNAEPGLSGYRIYRSENGGGFEFLKFVGKLNDSAIDFIGEHDRAFEYKITAKNNSGEESGFSNLAQAATFEMTDAELLTMVQQYTFRYFWDFAHPVSGMARERNSTSTVTSGGSGFGIMAILVGIERGFITREEGVGRLLKIVNFLETADRFHGAWPHWMNGATGAVIPFSEFDDGGDLVETAFLVQGLLTARECISGNAANEVSLREKITQLWETVEWNWYRKGVQNVLFWHWSPNFGWQINHEVRGFNEAQVVYILAIASPTFALPTNLYHDGWAGGSYTNGGTFFGYPLEVGPNRGGPLFFEHYSYLGFDPRYKKDAYANYFNNAVYHTLINRAYCIENPENHDGYSSNSWGLTASDDPFGYLAHEPTPARDNGTIAPTAALSSMPYTPGQSIAALKHFYREMGGQLWGKYGFYDAFNLDENWFASSYLAIDQGPIIGMIENYRTGLLWDCFMANPEIQNALDEIGFETDSTFVTGIDEMVLENMDIHLFPNPATDILTIELAFFKNSENVKMELLDLTGRKLKDVFFIKKTVTGKHDFQMDTATLDCGLYLLRLTTPGGVAVKKALILR
ncbi:MAG TPA: T9SS type A sorting domain-containing protein [Bacteroidetes bacterium]|nr:T9SS type A sorting domain-containing protein [Bacteroidota bacterium]